MTTTETAPRELYLPGEPAWRLDPRSPLLAEMARDAQTRTPDSPCDPESVAADLAWLPDLLRERHFGVAHGVIGKERAAEAERAVRNALEVLQHERPGTWGGAVSKLGEDLRDTLGDNHVRFAGGVAQRRDPGRSVVHPDGAEAMDIPDIAGVRVVTLRRLHGSKADEAALQRWAEGETHDFDHERILVDLRGNGGGNDGFVYEWALPRVPAAGPDPRHGAGWLLGGEPLLMWNTAAWLVARDGIDEVPARWSGALERLAGGHLTVEEWGPGEEFPSGSQPWPGRMIVLTDCGSASSGESSAYGLKLLFGAKIMGARSMGMTAYGNLVKYPLPGGTVLQLPSTHTAFPYPVEMVGHPVDHALDPHMPVEDVARRFDELWAAAG